MTMLEHSDDKVVLVDDNVAFTGGNNVFVVDNAGAVRQPACTI